MVSVHTDTASIHCTHEYLDLFSNASRNLGGSRMALESEIEHDVTPNELC